MRFSHKNKDIVIKYDPEDFPKPELIEPIAKKYQINLPSSYKGTSENPYLLMFFEEALRKDKWSILTLKSKLLMKEWSYPSGKTSDLFTTAN